MPEATKTGERQWLTDFATIFAHMWYRDFPVQLAVREKAQRADWTTHISIVVRSTADLMGLFTHFESGGRTDAILRDAKRPVALLEWEWAALHRGDEIITEFQKLMDKCCEQAFADVRFAGLIGYARATSPGGRQDYTKRLVAVLESYTKRWPTDLPPLLLVIISFRWPGKGKGGRQFGTMTIDKIAAGIRTRLREQPARPWDVVDSRWAQQPRTTV